MSDLDGILGYISEHEGRLTREAIDAELIRSGHERPAVDAAWAAFEARKGDPGPIATPRGAGTTFVAMLLIVVVLAHRLGLSVGPAGRRGGST